MAFGSASRSNRRRTPATRCTRPSIDGRCARRRNACSRGTSHTSITPGAPSTSVMRRYTFASRSTASTPGIARGARNARSAAHASGGAVRDAELEPAVDHEPVGHAALGAQLGGRELEHVVHDPVHLPDAVEAGRGRDLRHGQVGVVEQATGEVRAPRTRHLARRRAHVLREEATQVTRARAEPRRELVFGHVVERAVGDAVHGAAHELGRGDPADLRDPIRTAPQAGPEPGRLRGGRVVERAEVALQRRRRTPHRTAVDARGDDSGERVHDPVLGHPTRQIRTRAPNPAGCPDPSIRPA